MAKTLTELQWVEDLIIQQFIRKPMFGGFAYYDHEILKLVIFEGGLEKNYRDKIYDFEIWNGCMFPLGKEHHSKYLSKYRFLIRHPVLTKWLYLPLKTENFDESIEKMIREIKKPDTVWGTISERSKTKKSKKSDDSKLLVQNLDVSAEQMRTPQSFQPKKKKNKK